MSVCQEPYCFKFLSIKIPASMLHNVLFLFTVYIVVFVLSQKTHDSNIGLRWDLDVSSKNRKKIILNKCHGYARIGKLHALVGPSGSGKSTLLNSLANVIKKGSLIVEGEIERSNQLESTPIYVEQEDLLFPQLTVQETLDTSLSFRKGTDKRNGKKVNKSLVEKLILDLGLKKTRKSKVGDAKTKGISGGEKKRLSIGNELIRELASNSGDKVGKRIIFADEPTSGLDSFQAQKVMELLKELANEGNIVIASIHQPRASIYNLFDDITLLSEGKTMYCGEAGTKMVKYFTSIDFPLPPNVNPAEHYLDLIAVDSASKERELDSLDRIDLFAEQSLKKAKSYKQVLNTDSYDSITTSSGTTSKGATSISNSLNSGIRKFGLLFRRALKTVTRDKSLNIARFMSSLFSGLLFGGIYWKLPATASSVADRMGLLQVAAVNTAMTSLIKATTSFVTEKLIIQRERRVGSYGVLPYFLSKLAAEVPISAFFPCLFGVIMYKSCGLNSAPQKLFKFLTILIVESMAATAFGMSVGSLVSSVEAGTAIAPAVFVIFIIFGGLYRVNVPSYLSWLPNASLIRWSYEGLCLNEFKGLAITPEARGGPLSVKTGDEVLESMKIHESDVIRTLKSQGVIIAVNYIFTFCSLYLQRPQYEPLKPRGSRSSSSSSNKMHNDSVMTANANGNDSISVEDTAAVAEKETTVLSSSSSSFTSSSPSYSSEQKKKAATTTTPIPPRTV